jgi:23S rRNA pseudouridine1911/1915/1917 synthase
MREVVEPPEVDVLEAGSPAAEEGDDADGCGNAFGNPKAVVIRFEIPPDLDGARADHALVFKVRRLSKNRAQRIIKGGDFRSMTRGALKPSSRLKRGTIVELWRIPPDEPDPHAAEPAVLFEGDGLFVVDKPGDLVVHPSARYLHQTLTTWLRRRFAPEAPPHPCHRLDRETSGVLVCARGDAEAAVKTAFARGDVEKTYLAVVRGAFTTPLTISHPLGLQGERGLVRIRMVRDDATGLPSRTDVEPLFHDVEANRSLVVCRPRTGRQHQIRAHLQLEGFPLVGDKLYAMGDAWFDAFTRRGGEEHGVVPDDVEHRRQALHAYETSLLLAGKPHVFRAPLPDELLSLVPALRGTELEANLRAGAPLSSLTP